VVEFDLVLQLPLVSVLPLLLASTPLTDQGPFVEDDAGVRDYGNTVYELQVQHLEPDFAVWRDSLQLHCHSVNGPRALGAVADGWVLAAAVHAGGTSWLVSGLNRNLRVAPLQCSGNLVVTAVPGGSTYLASGEVLIRAAAEASGTLLVLTSQRLLRLDPVQGPPETLFTLTDLEQELLTPEERLENQQPGAGFGLVDLLATPDGARWYLVQQVLNGGIRSLWLLRQVGTGPRTPVLVDRSGASLGPRVFRVRGIYNIVSRSLLYEPGRQLLVLVGEISRTPAGGTISDWRHVFGLFSLAAPSLRVLDLGVAAPVRPISSRGDGLFVRVGSPLQWAPVRFDGATDVDGDRLTFDEEQRLGTSDLELDSDGDGVADHLELHRFGSDPTDAGSRPPPLTSAVTRYAFSSRLSEWRQFPKQLFDTGEFRPALVTDHAYCTGLSPTNCTAVACTGFERYTCYGKDGTVLAGVVVDAGMPKTPSFEADGQSWWTGNDDGLSYTEAGVVRWSDGVQACNGIRCSAVRVAGKGVAFGYGPLLGGTSELRRYTPTGWSRVCIEGDCVVRPRGADEATAELLVTHTVNGRERLFGLGADGGLGFLLDSRFLDSFAVSSAWVDPVNRTLLLGLPTGGARDRALTLGPTFEPLGPSAPALTPDGPWFRHGFQLKRQVGFMHAPNQGGGSSSCPRWAPPEACSPSPGAKRLPYPVFIDVHGELLPVDGRVRPGDVVFWVNALMVGGGTAAGDFGGLWLHRESGATDLLLPLSDWAGRATSEAAASLAALAPRAARQLALSPAREALCVALDDGRLFEWSLADGLLTSLRLVQPSGVRGCAYAADGTLAVLEATRTVVGGAEFAVPAGQQGERLHATPSGWIVELSRPGQSVFQQSARCLDPAGQPVGAEVSAVAALAYQGGVVTWVEVVDTLTRTATTPAEAQGMAYASRLDPFCAGEREEVVAVRGPAQPESLWKNVFETVIGFGEGLLVPGGALARRPDGLLLVGAFGSDTRDRGGADSTGKFLYELFWRVMPAYHPLQGEGIAAHAAWRREDELQIIPHDWPASVSAAATVPGEVPADWGEATRYECLGRGCTPYVLPAGATTDGGVTPGADAGPTGPGGPPTGCGCGAAQLEALLAAALFLLLRRRAPAR
jgi:hypothetical protein